MISPENSPNDSIGENEKVEDETFKKENLSNVVLENDNLLESKGAVLNRKQIVSSAETTRIEKSLSIESSNPWAVEDPSVFLKYCCPECNCNFAELYDFGKHARENHEMSNILFQEYESNDLSKSMEIEHNENDLLK